MTDIATWLGQQLDEDQAGAEAAQGEVWVKAGSGEDFGPALSRLLFHRRHDPARVLREVAAKRAILAAHWDGHGCPTCLIEMDADEDSDGNQHQYPVMHWTTPCPTTRLLAAPYAGCDGYDPAWRVE